MEIIFSLHGTTPLIVNRFTDEAALAATVGTRGALRGTDSTPQEIAESKLYKAADGTLVVPQPNLLSCFIEAGRFFRSGKQKLTTLKSSIIPGCVHLDAIAYPIEHEQPWKVDTRPVRIPTTGGRILMHRPIFEDWALSLSAWLELEDISPSLFRQLIDRAGRSIGLGDFRPACKGPYGRFRVDRWEEKATA